ncbi:Van1p [Ascoidea rubescens DSM 1968]|uniref:Glycosyltransferase family 62 protein n=1 Tax=Ascoidea rubescens DSM 1968 TaxID=1344418 RepID=A0A1D2VQB6_9ASCO|nr:glycosyltransferase family 62 protein [Ascoidea rubescens DSM 1968]ODV63794.1 glycosyltransferase family 62 protein [Ascoidea rubescens DSM 1968]
MRLRDSYNKKSDLPYTNVSETDKFRPIKKYKRFSLSKIVYLIIILFLLVLIFRKDKKDQLGEILKDKFSSDINIKKNDNELRYPDSSKTSNQNNNNDINNDNDNDNIENTDAIQNNKNDDDYDHYTVTSDQIINNKNDINNDSNNKSPDSQSQNNRSKENSEKDEELEKIYRNTVAYYDLNDFQGSPFGKDNNQLVLLCIPLRNAQHVLPLMFKHLMDLDYPHRLIDLAFLVSDCSENDKTLDTLFEYTMHLQNSTLMSLLNEQDDLIKERNRRLRGTNDLYLRYMDPDYVEKIQNAFKPPYHSEFNNPFRSVQIFRKDFGQVIGQGFSDRHDVKVQGIRRKLMGRARNWLVSTSLKPYHSWVYWRDADIEQSSSSIIQDLMKHDYDVVVPNVWRPLPEFLGNEQPYDLNTWIESEQGLELAKTLQEDDVIVEGYAEYPTWRVHLAYLRDSDGNPDQLVDMDGVGGVSILAKARIFRQGVTFPAFTYKNHAETEAFGKMTKDFGFKVGGLPHYTVWHIYEPSEDDLQEIARKERKKRRQQKIADKVN